VLSMRGCLWRANGTQLSAAGAGVQTDAAAAKSVTEVVSSHFVEVNNCSNEEQRRAGKEKRERKKRRWESGSEFGHAGD
jgi:ribosomal protein S12 methylthiotransferase accessory factor YcaO